MAMAVAPGLIRYAARYTQSIHDAEDAYQRSMEIALTRAPVTEQRAFMAWLYTVIRNEAITICRRRRREAPAMGEDVAVSLTERAETELGPDAVAEWRERYGVIRDGLAGLTESQRVCLMLKSAGASYAEIADVTGFSLRKIERSVLEGRERLHAWQLRVDGGGECERLRAAIDRVAEHDGSQEDVRAVTRHVRHCGGCRSALSARRQSIHGLAALVPVALVATHVMSVHTPDPSIAFTYWDRLGAGFTLRASQAVQHAMELPSLVGAKVGAGAVALAVAGAAGAPLVIGAVHGPPAKPPPAATRLHLAAATGAATAPVARRTAPRLAAPRGASTPMRTASLARRTAAGGASRQTAPSIAPPTPPPPPRRSPSSGPGAVLSPWGP
jgi:RNA polymerase sigma factor (sigma-70 family)